MFTKRLALVLFIPLFNACLFSTSAGAHELDGTNSAPTAITSPKKFTAPENDPEFTVFPNGRAFWEFNAVLVPGRGEPWTEIQQADYEKIKQLPVDKVQWALMDLDTGKMLSESAPSSTRIFGASTSKMFVVSALLDKQNGEVKSYPSDVKETKGRKGKALRPEYAGNDDLDHMVRIYMRSNNHSWVLLQQRIGIDSSGTPDADRGRVGVIEFTEKLGYHHNRGWQGDLALGNFSLASIKAAVHSFLRRRFKVSEDKIHGNELTAADTVRYLYDTYWNRYPGAEYAWKLLYTCQTGGNKGNKYMPNNIFVGGKTGTYPGGSAAMTEVNGSKKPVSVYNHALTFYNNGTQYGLVVLTDMGNPEYSAILAGGLVREFAGVKELPLPVAPEVASAPARSLFTEKSAR